MKKALKITSLLLIVLVLSLGLVSCKHKEPSDHTPVGDWLSDENYHWHACEKEKCENAGDKAEHTYDNACDKDCNVCGAERTPASHVYTNACDKDCNVCGVTRTPSAHVYDNACDAKCNVCNAERTPSAHVYDNACDAKCNVCNAERTPSAHVYDNDCDTKCNVCNAERTVGAHVYDNACDAKCNVCNAERTPSAHVYDNACDAKCNVCNADRTPSAHEYDDDCDTTCNVCGETRTVTHIYDQCVEEDEYLKAEATSTTKKQYWKSCECGAKSDTEYFEVDKLLPNLEIVNDISKTYDGTPVSEPEIEFDGVGGECFEYWQGETKLPGRPTNAGTYKVVVIIYETETHAADRVEAEFTIAKKVLSNLTAELTYAGTNSFEVPLGEVNGIVAGDVADGIKVCITFANKNVGAAVTGAGLDADDGDNYTNYELDLTTCTASIVPKVITNISLGDVTYKGSTNFSFAFSAPHGEIFLLEVTTASKNVGNAVEITSVSYANNNYSIDKSAITLNIVPKTINVTAEFEYSGTSVRQIHAPSPSLSDVIDGDEVYIEVTFDKAGVDATVLTGEDAPYLDGADSDNYTLGTYSFSIVPKKLTLKAGEKIETTETYSGKKQHTISVSSNLFDGYVDAEAAQLWLTATLPSKNAGEYTDGVILTPYVGNTALGTVSHNYDFSEVAATVKVDKMTVYVSGVTAEYNGTTQFTFDKPLRLTSAHTGGGQDSILSNDEIYLNSFTLSSPDVSPEELLYEGDFVLSGADACNYYIEELAVEITKKKLTNLHLYITVDTYTSGVITLLPKDGIVAGEVVKITITNVNDQDFWDGFYIDMQLSDGTAPDAYRYETIAFVASGDYANYEFATYDDGYGNQVVGIVEGVAECDVQFDGSCSCGGHLNPVTVNSSSIYTSIPSAIGWTDGVYKINNTESGYWYIDPEMDYAVITGVYDAEGNMVPVSQSGFYAEEGVYYVHLKSASGTALTEAKGLEFHFSYTLYNTAASGYYYESDYVSGVAGSEYYFKVTSDMNWGSSLGIFDENENEHEASKYTIKVYDSSYNEIADVTYSDREDLYYGENMDGMSDMDIYIAVCPVVDIEFYISIY